MFSAAQLSDKAISHVAHGRFCDSLSVLDVSLCFKVPLGLRLCMRALACVSWHSVADACLSNGRRGLCCRGEPRLSMLHAR